MTHFNDDGQSGSIDFEISAEQKTDGKWYCGLRYKNPNGSITELGCETPFNTEKEAHDEAMTYARMIVEANFGPVTKAEHISDSEFKKRNPGFNDPNPNLN